MSRHARTTSLHRPTTSGLQLHRHARHVSRGSSSSTHRTHESMPGGKMVAGASSRATPLPSFARRPRRAIAESIQATPSIDAPQGSSARNGSAISSSSLLLPCSGAVLESVVSRRTSRCQTANPSAGVPAPFAGPSSERDEHPSAPPSRSGDYAVEPPPSMAEPTRLLCREKRNISKAKRLNPEPSPSRNP